MTLTPSEQRAVEAAKAWLKHDSCNEPSTQRLEDVLESDMLFGFACGYVARDAEVEALRALLGEAQGWIPPSRATRERIDAALKEQA